MKNLDQLRAANALVRIKALDGESDDFKKRYRSYVDRLGPAILMNTLGQALATEKAAAGTNDKQKADKQPHDELYRSVEQWLCREDGVYPQDKDILKAITSHDEAHYIRAQAEALAWLDWHKRCCRAAFPEGDSEE